MFIVFEHIDGAGASSLSLDFMNTLNEKFKDEQGDLIIDPLWGDFEWHKEPLFTTDEANFLNSPACKDPVKREVLFYKSRLKHQELIKTKNIVCDRYIWSGIAYASIYSPTTFEFAKGLYLDEDLFMAPDLYVFVDTPVEECYKRVLIRGEDESMDYLIKKRRAYFDTMKYILSPIIVADSSGRTEEDKINAVSNLYEKFKKFVERQSDHIKV